MVNEENGSWGHKPWRQGMKYTIVSQKQFMFLMLLKKIMIRKKLSNRNIIIVIAIFLAVVFFMFKLSEKQPASNFHIQFRGKITKITKYYRGRYDVELNINRTNKIILSDYNLGIYKEKVRVGDSLVKSNNTDCFYYKRNDIKIAESCNNILEIDTISTNGGL